MRALFSLALILIAGFSFQQAKAQLPYKESFTRSSAPGMVFGGRTDDPNNHDAFLTANTDSAGINGNPNDADGAGYLRLTKNLNNQAGFVRNTASFPSAEGLSITFEYYTHGGGGADYGANQHADGISIFLFDATASPFQFGAYGGSLGYAQRSGGLTGVSKGFLGVGIDEFGNFATNKEGKSGGNTEDVGASSDTWEGYNESSVTLRGDGDGNSNAATNYEWLLTKKTYADLATFPGVTYPGGFLIRGNVDGRTMVGAGRTSGGLLSTENGYRKVKVDIEPNGGGTFKVNVRITEGKSGVAVPHHVVVDYIYTPTTTAPANLSYGFGASTGGRTNVHEIRSLDIVIPASVIKVPVAVADVAVTTKNTPKTFDIISNDSDANGNFQLDLNTVDLDPVAVGRQTSKTVTNQGTYVYAVVGTVGQVTFTPDASFEGVATPITYTITDNGQDIEGAVITATSTSVAANITVTVIPPITGTAAVCMGSTTDLDNTVSGGTWTSSATGVATVNATTGVVTPVSVGTTTISYTLSGTAVTQLVTVNAIPTTPTASVVGGGSTTGCASPGVQLTSNSATGNQWYRGVTLLVGATSQTYTATASGTYTVIVTTSGCPSASSNGVVVTINPLPTITLTNANPEICIGATSANIPYSATTNGANQYSIDWNAAANTAGIPDVATATLVASDITVPSLGAIAAGTYTGSLTVINSTTGCISAVATVTVKINALPAAPLITGASAFCAGGNLILTSDGTGAHQWYKDNVLMTGETAATLTVTAAGVYTVTATQGTSCISPKSTGKTITVTTPATPLVTGANSFCAGGNLVLTSDGTGAHQWYKDNVLITGATNATLTVTTAGVYTVTATQGTACISAKSADKTITVTALPTIGSIAGASTVVIGSTTTFTNTPAGGTWTSDDLTIATVNATSGVITGVAAGTANIKYTVTSGGCASEAVKAITITAAAGGVNNPPVVQDITKTGVKDTPVPFAIADFSDASHYSDPEGVALTKVKITSLPPALSGKLRLSGADVVQDQEINRTDLVNLTFVPATGFTGTAAFQWNGYDDVQYAVTNKTGTITIAATNAPPVVQDITKTGVKDTPVTFAATDFNDANHYSDPEGVALVKVRISTLPSPSTGLLKLAGVNITAGDEIPLASLGNITFAPATGYTGSVSFLWNGSDGVLYAANNKTVNITINATNNPPVVQDISVTTTGFTPYVFTPTDFSNKYADPELSPLARVKITSLPLSGVLKFNGVVVTLNQEIPAAQLGGLTFEAPVNFNGTIPFGWNGYDGIQYALAPARVNVSIILSGDPTAKIGLAKNLASVKPALNGTYDVKFVFTTVNYGLNALERVSIKDNLSQAFGGAEVTVKTVTAFGNLKVNPLYNGSTDTELLLQTSRLSAGEEAFVEMLVNVRLQLSSGLFQNTATAEGYSTINGLRVTDVSSNGLKPDPLVSNDVSPSDPTPIQLDVQPLYSPQGFSPNGDGVNDAFVIQNAQGKLVALEVYNRWGNRVYKSADYKNDWTGQVTEGFFLGRDIPDGTYYYVIVIENKDKYVGFITINR